MYSTLTFFLVYTSMKVTGLGYVYILITIVFKNFFLT